MHVYNRGQWWHIHLCVCACVCAQPCLLDEIMHAGQHWGDVLQQNKNVSIITELLCLFFFASVPWLIADLGTSQKNKSNLCYNKGRTNSAFGRTGDWGERRNEDYCQKEMMVTRKRKSWEEEKSRQGKTQERDDRNTCWRSKSTLKKHTHRLQEGYLWQSSQATGGVFTCDDGGKRWKKGRKRKGER